MEKHKKRKYKLLIFLFIILGINGFLIIKLNFLPSKHSNSSEKSLYLSEEYSGTVSLSFNEHVMVHDLHKGGLEWSFSSSNPSVEIRCLLMGSSDYYGYQHTGSYSYIVLSSGSHTSDSGSTNLGSYSDWYIIFEYYGSDAGSTTLTYSVNFIVPESNTQGSPLMEEILIIIICVVLAAILGVSIVFYVQKSIRKIEKKQLNYNKYHQVKEDSIVKENQLGQKESEVCPECGNLIIDEEDTFCGNCGYKIH